MIDKLHSSLCAVLLSTGQLNVIDLETGATLFTRHLQFDGQLKLALHQVRSNTPLGVQLNCIALRSRGCWARNVSPSSSGTSSASTTCN